MVEGWEPRDNREGMSVLGVIRPVAEGGEHIHDFDIRERAVIGHDGERAVIVFRDCVRVDFSQGEDEYGSGIPIRLMVDERHLRCLVEVQGDVVVVAAEIHGAPFCLQSVIMFYYICPVLWTFPVRFHASFTIRHAFSDGSARFASRATVRCATVAKVLSACCFYLGVRAGEKGACGFGHTAPFSVTSRIFHYPVPLSAPSHQRQAPFLPFSSCVHRDAPWHPPGCFRGR